MIKFECQNNMFKVKQINLKPPNLLNSIIYMKFSFEILTRNLLSQQILAFKIINEINCLPPIALNPMHILTADKCSHSSSKALQLWQHAIQG